MSNNIYREYKFKFYLNANHFIYIDGVAGMVHPHTWEFEICIMRDSLMFVEFSEFEKAIEKYFAKYQNRVINEVEPFDKIVPTLENMADYFIEDIRKIVREIGGEVVMMESSETPTRSYLLGFQDDSKFVKIMEKNNEEKTREMIDELIDSIIN